jgi:hypothetical protein
MSKAILSPGRFLPNIIGTIIAHLRNAAKVVETAFNDTNSTQQLQKIAVVKKHHNNRRQTDGRKRFSNHYC